MKTVFTRLRKDRKGNTLVEYALLLCLVAVVAVGLFGSSFVDYFVSDMSRVYKRVYCVAQYPPGTNCPM